MNPVRLKIICITLIVGMFLNVSIIVAQSNNTNSLTKDNAIENEIQRIQKEIDNNNLGWQAGYTTVSNTTRYCGLMPEDKKNIDDNQEFFNVSTKKTYESFDWREYNNYDWTTPIKNQRRCGSCWAFGCLAAMESRIKIIENIPNTNIDLSEQYLVSCSPGDCDGGQTGITLFWMRGNGAISESCFTYRASDYYPCEGKCEQWRENLVGIRDTSRVPSNIDHIQAGLVEYGPLIAGMTIYDSFDNYRSGIYRPLQSEEIEGYHCVCIVGFDNREEYWICKNSWGTGWGMDGWFKIAFGECDIENSVHCIKDINYSPAIPEKPLGVNEGKAGRTYEVTISTADGEGDNIKYCIDWGDGNNTWTDTVASGDEVTARYKWPKEERGELRFYEIRVKAKDSYGLETEWSEPLKISIKTPWLDQQKNESFETLRFLFPIIDWFHSPLEFLLQSP